MILYNNYVINIGRISHICVGYDICYRLCRVYLECRQLTTRVKLARIVKLMSSVRKRLSPTFTPSYATIPAEYNKDIRALL